MRATLFPFQERALADLHEYARMEAQGELLQIYEQYCSPRAAASFFKTNHCC